MAPLATRRLAKELDLLQKGETPVGCQLLNTDNIMEWYISVSVLGEETVYRNEVFCLRFRFTMQYPIDSPEVLFVVDKQWKAPVHPHVYSNGHLCLSILGDAWSPVLNVSSICLSIQSMLASCTAKKLPPDNDRYVVRPDPPGLHCSPEYSLAQRSAPLSPKNTRFAYHDEYIFITLEVHRLNS